MTTGADRAHPYSIIIDLCVCTCATHPLDWGHYANVTRALADAAGYWNVYCGFWGDIPRLINVAVVDSRDGRIVWRNGRQLVEVEEHGNTEQDHRSVNGGRPGPGHRHSRMGHAAQFSHGGYAGPFAG